MATSVLGLKTFAASDPVDYNEVNDNYNKIDNGVKTALQGRAARSLLNNSDFRAGWRIAQAGMNGIHGSMKYACDRWISWDADAIFTDEYIKPMSPLDQRLNPAIIEMNATYTVAVCLSDGTVRVDSGTFANGFGSYGLGIYCPPATTQPYVRLASEGDRFRWADLYLGAYTADNLPEHQPNGYTAELVECQRYYWRYWQNNNFDIGHGYMNTTDTANITFDFPTKMRIAPTITIGDISTLRVMCVNGLKGATAYSVVKTTDKQMMVGFTLDSTSTAFTPCVMRSNSGTTIEFSADL